MSQPIHAAHMSSALKTRRLFSQYIMVCVRCAVSIFALPNVNDDSREDKPDENGHVRGAHFLISRSYSVCGPIQNQTRLSPSWAASVRVFRFTLADQRFPTFLKCSEGCEEFALSRANYLSAWSRTSLGSAR